MKSHAHRPEPPSTLAVILEAAAFGALFLFVAIVCYELLVLWLAWAAPPPVAP